MWSAGVGHGGHAGNRGAGEAGAFDLHGGAGAGNGGTTDDGAGKTSGARSEVPGLRIADDDWGRATAAVVDGGNVCGDRRVSDHYARWLEHEPHGVQPVRSRWTSRPRVGRSVVSQLCGAA